MALVASGAFTLVPRSAAGQMFGGDTSNPAPPEPPPTPPSTLTPEEEGELEPSAEPPPSSLPNTSCEGRLIHSITVDGNARVAEPDVLSATRLRLGATCRDTEISRAARAIWGLTFFDNLVIEANEVDEGIDIVIRVHERPSIGRVTFEGATSVERNELDEKVTLHEGDPALIHDIREQLPHIRDLYAEKGYFLATVRFEIRPLANNEAEIAFIVVEGPQVRVRSIRFSGNRAFTDAELRSNMQTGETEFFSFISNNNRYRQAQFDEDVNRLRAFFYDRGYMDATIGTPRLDLSADRKDLDITIPITEGERFRVGRVRVMEVDASGAEVEPLGGRRHVRELVGVNPGEWFSITRVQLNFLQIQRLYRDAGYARVNISTDRTELDHNRHTVSVVVEITRGPLVTVERVQVRGNSRTRDLVIRREFPLAEGELFNASQLEEGKARVQALGFFDRVDVSEEEGSAPDRIVINIEVAERSTGQFQVGAGFATYESFLVNAQIQEQNFLGTGRVLGFQTTLSGIRQFFTLHVQEPYFLDTQWAFGVDVFRQTRQFPSFTREGTGGSFSFGHPVFDYRLRFFVSYTAEYVDIQARTGGLNISLDPGLTVGYRLPLANLLRSGLTSSLRLQLAWDSRNDRMFPTSGIYASFSTEWADEVIGSQNTYLRNILNFRWYNSLAGAAYDAWVLRLNSELGLITSRLPQGVPIWERFYLGGIVDLRGLPFRAIGPRANLPLRADPNAGGSPYGEPIGGNIRFYYNLELEFPIISSARIRGVAFTDGGNAWNLEGNLCGAPNATIVDSAADVCGVNPFDLRTSWGFGVRWYSPFGVLRFEWGIPFQRRTGERDVDFQFMIGNFF